MRSPQRRTSTADVEWRPVVTLRSVCSAITLVACCSAAVRAQDTAQPKFDVASIKPNRTEATSMGGSSVVRNRRLAVVNVSLQRLVAGAFGVNASDQVLNLPDWAK